MLYVQHLLGTGHQHRMAAISRALSNAGVEVCYVSGGMPIPGLETNAARLLQLPPARAADTRYGVLLDVDGVPVDQRWQDARRKRLLDGFRDFCPDVLVIESFPFGRRLVSFELLPLLEASRRCPHPPRVLCSIRDILEPKSKPERNAQTVGCLQQYFHGVLVHSDPRFVSLEASFPLVGDIRHMLHYTGYVHAGRSVDDASDAGCDEIIVSAGGGVVAESLIRSVFGARSLTSLNTHRWRCLLGSNVPEALFDELSRIAPEGVFVERNRSDFQTLLRNCRLSVSQAGYNTVLDVLVSGAPAVLAPFGDGHEREQSLRAEAVSALTQISVVLPAELTAPRLARAVEAAIGSGRRVAPVIDLDGATATARLLGAAPEGAS